MRLNELDGEQPRAIFLIGLPGSGKSTWCRRYLALATRPTVVVSSDDLIDEWAQEHGLNYSEAFRQIDFRKIEHQMLERLKRAIDNRDDIIIDRTNMTKKSRRKLLDLFPSGYRREAVVFEIEPEELRRRLLHREETTGKHIPDNVVANMLASYVSPGEDEFDFIHLV